MSTLGIFVHNEAMENGVKVRSVYLWGALLASFAYTLSLESLLLLDFWWQIAEARWILEHRVFPRINPFSYLSQLPNYVAGEWLSGMIFYLFYKGMGAFGAVFLRGISLSLVAVFWWRALSRSRSHLVLAAGLTVAGLLVLLHRFPPRPEMWTVLFLAGLASGAISRKPLVLAPLFALWANLHGGFAFGLGYLLLGGKLVPLLFAAAGCFLNPYGWRIFQAPWEHAFGASFMFSVATEGEFQAGVFSVVAVLLAVSLILSWKRRESLVLLAFGLFALKLHRAAPMFYAVAWPILGARFLELLPRLRPVLFKAVQAVFLTGVVLASVFRILAHVPQALNQAAQTKFLPEKACRFMENAGIQGKVFASMHYGSYLNWRLYPQVKVFFDGRYISIPVERQMQESLTSQAAWNQFLHRTQADYILMDWATEGVAQGLRLPWVPRGRSPYLGLYPARDWALIYWDDRSLLFARRPVSLEEFRWTEPLNFDATLQDISEGRIKPEKVKAELDRALELSGNHKILEAMREALKKFY